MTIDAQTRQVMRNARQIHGWLDNNEMAVLHDLARAIPHGGLIVEIGTYRGRSTVILASAAQLVAGRVITIDPYNTVMREGVNETPVTTDDRDFMLSYLELYGVANAVTSVVSTSADAARQWDGRPIDLLWVDGSHDYEDVSADLRLWSPHVRGYIAMHDTSGSWAGVSRALNEFVAQGEWHVIQVADATSVLARKSNP